MIHRLSAMGVDDEHIAIAAGYGDGNGNHNVYSMLRGASSNPERRLERLQALAAGSVTKGLAAVIAELMAAGYDDRAIIIAAGFPATSTPKYCVSAMVRGTCKDAAGKHQRLEKIAARYSESRFAAIVTRLRQADWTDSDIALAIGYDDLEAHCSVDTLLKGDPKDVQSRYTALRQMMHRVNQARSMRSLPRK
jgi:hypothetical protein